MQGEGEFPRRNPYGLNSVNEVRSWAEAAGARDVRAISIAPPGELGLLRRLLTKNRAGRTAAGLGRADTESDRKV